MTWIGWSVFWFIVFIAGIVCWTVGRRMKLKYQARLEAHRSPDNIDSRGRAYGNGPVDYSGAWRIGGMITAGVGAGLWLLFTIWTMVVPVGSGEVGLVYQFDKLVGQKGAGINLVLPWQEVTNVNVKTQHEVFDGKAQITAASKDTQDVYMNATLNYALSDAKVQELYKTVGPNWFDVLVRPRVNNDVKEQTTKYEATAVLENREKIRQDTKTALAAELQPYSITVTDFLITNVDFTPEFKTAVEQKQAAAQGALKAQNDANAAVATAGGAAQATKINADAQAAANSEIAASVTPGLIEYQKALALGNWRPSVIGDPNVIVSGVNVTPPAGG